MDKKKILIIGFSLIVLVVLVFFATSGIFKEVDVTENRNIGDKVKLGVVTDGGVLPAPGASVIEKETNVVLNTKGEEAKNNTSPMNPDAPQQSFSIKNKNEIPAGAVQLSVSAGGFFPKTFSVNGGEPVVVSVTSVDSQTHVFAFKDSSLSAVAIGVGPGETRLISFNAPGRSGDYTFYCNVPKHEVRGEVGTMIVK